jgi:hypothetical protein
VPLLNDTESAPAGLAIPTTPAVVASRMIGAIALNAVLSERGRPDPTLVVSPDLPMCCPLIRPTYVWCET